MKLDLELGILVLLVGCSCSQTITDVLCMKHLIYVSAMQGMDDEVVPPSMADCISRLLPQATIHRLPDEGHFSFYFFCDECHQQMFSTLFGVPRGPLDKKVEVDINEEPLMVNPALE